MRNAMFPLSLSNYGSNELRNGRTSSEPDRSICYPGLLPSSLACNSIQFRSSVAPHSPSHPTHCWPTVSKCYYPEATGEGKMATGGPYVKMEGAVGRRKWEYETASSISKKRSATLEKDGKLADSRKKRSPGVNHPGTPSTDPRQTKPPVRKSQKLGDKVNALQQLVSPFGKTDTASVLQETTVYIKRLQEQIQVLSMPYFSYRPFPVRGGDDDKLMDLRSRGLCLVPVSTTTTNIENQETEIASRLGGLTALPHV